MSKSGQREMIAVLWLIAALLALDGGHVALGCTLAIKAVLDYFTSIYFSIKETELTQGMIKALEEECKP